MNRINLPSKWESVQFNYLFDRLIRKNIVGNKNVLTISARHGLIRQEEFFNKNIASDNLSTYYLLKRGDFVYNKSYSMGYGCGAFKQLTRYDIGVISPLYICFSASQNNQCPDFYVQYFESMLIDRAIKVFAQKGARNHGLLNITIGDFFTMRLLLPPLAEQCAIAEILTTADRLIALKEQLIAAKRKQKRWLMQQLLTGKTRLPGFNGEWESVRLGKYLEEYTEKTTLKNQYPILTSARRGLMLQTDYYTDNQITTDENIGYNVLPYGYITFRSRSDDGVFVFNENKLINNGIISYYYPVFSFDESVCHDFMLALLNFSIRRLAYSFVEGTAQQVLTLKKLGKFKLTVPPLPEQRAIAAVLKTADREIELLAQELEQQRQVKKYLMQQLLTGRIRTKEVSPI
jgi:type I restriction enzyme S subunit